MAQMLKQLACSRLEALFWYSPLQSEESFQSRQKYPGKSENFLADLRPKPAVCRVRMAVG